MKGARIRLFVAAVAFLAWIGWLAYLAFDYAKPTVVSRSQMMLAPDPAEAKIFVENGRPTRVEIVRFLGKTPDKDRNATGEIQVEDLLRARTVNDKPLTDGTTYLLPLSKLDGSRYLLVAPPRSPGGETISMRPLVYPFNAEVEKQVRDLLPK